MVNRINHLTASARAKSRMKLIPYVCQMPEHDHSIRSGLCARFGCLNFNDRLVLHNITVLLISREVYRVTGYFSNKSAYKIQDLILEM